MNRFNTLHRVLPAAGRVASLARFLLAGGVVAASCNLGLREVAAQKSAAPPGRTSASIPATSKQIKLWIQQLNDDRYTVRQSAGEQLLQAGTSAREPLLALVDGPDPETRAAARRLVALIDRTEFHRRVAAFAADVDGRQRLTLPGWEKYRQLVGRDPAARALFVDMQQQEGAMLSAVFGVSTQPSHELWEERMQRLVQWQAIAGNQSVAPPLGSCSAMLFLGAIAEMDVSDRGAMLVDLLLQRPPLREAIQIGNHRDAVRRLVAAWILHCPNQSEIVLQRRLSMASMNGLEKAVPLALAVAGGDPQYRRVQPQTKAAAILVVGQLGSRKHAERLEPLLEDTSVCYAPGAAPGLAQPANVQVRDVALVVMLHLTDQRPTDYGYLNARMQSQEMFQLQTLFAENDEQRAEAAAKWRAWKAEQKSRESSVEGQKPDAAKQPD